MPESVRVVPLLKMCPQVPQPPMWSSQSILKFYCCGGEYSLMESEKAIMNFWIWCFWNVLFGYLHLKFFSDIAAFPDSVNILEDVSGDIRTPDKLIDRVNDTTDGRHMWLAPVLPGLVHFPFSFHFSDVHRCS